MLSLLVDWETSSRSIGQLIIARTTMRTKESVRKAASAQSPDAAEEAERRCFVGQCKKGDCCLEDGHADSCNDGNMSEEEYEVERITAEKAARGGKRKFLVKWKGWPSEDSTWESSAALEGAKEVSARRVATSPILSPSRSPILLPSLSPSLNPSLNPSPRSRPNLSPSPSPSSIRAPEPEPYTDAPEPEPTAKPAPSPRQVLAAWEREVASRVDADSVVAQCGRSRRPGSGRARHRRA